jgi:hypothetical protein
MSEVKTRRDAEGIRLVQDTFNATSMALYASLGFEAKEPLVLLAGVARSQPPSDFAPLLPSARGGSPPTPRHWTSGLRATA